VTDEYKAKLQALLRGYAERAAKVEPANKTPQDQADRRMCGSGCGRSSVPCSTRSWSSSRMPDTMPRFGNTSSATTPTQRGPLLHAAIRTRLGAHLPLRPRHGIVVQREVKHAPGRTAAHQHRDRLGTIGITAVSAPWVETKTLAFIEAVLKAN